MFLKLLLCVLIVQQGQCVSRLQIRTQFQSILLRLHEFADGKYTDADRAYDTLVDHLYKQQTRTKNVTDTQIDILKSRVSAAKNNSATDLNCLKNHESAVSGLSCGSFDECLKTANLTALCRSKEKFQILADIALNTASNCEFLNPLETQLESYRKCLAEKVSDLNRQIDLVVFEYQEMSNFTLNHHTWCLAERAGAIVGEISLIGYEVNLCSL